VTKGKRVHANNGIKSSKDHRAIPFLLGSSAPRGEAKRGEVEGGTIITGRISKKTASSG